MKLKLFGKEVLSFSKNKAELFIHNATEALDKSKFLPDFRSMGNGTNLSSGSFISIDSLSGKQKKNKADTKPKIKELTPKEVHKLKLLNTEFDINVNEEYVDDQIQQFTDKLNLIQVKEYDVSRGTNEIASILIRMKNRKKYAQFSEFYDNYIYTTTTKITELVKKHNYLKMDLVDQFMADMPKEALDAMKNYTKNTEKLCDKKPVFYIIANKKDFEKTQSRRDPILLAQSPFGHFWQILGAWDEEMLFLEEL